MKTFIFSILRRLYYFINNLYFNYFLNLKNNLKIKNKKKDFVNFFNKKIEIYKRDNPEFYEDIDLYKFKKISIYTGIDLPESGDFSFGAFLHHTLQEYLKNFNDELTVFEIGTAKGFSALCFALALQKYPYSSKIITIDVISSHKRFYQKTFHTNLKISRKEIMRKIDPKLLNKIFFLQADSLSDLSKTFINRINFCFIDGEHNKKFLTNELNFVKNFQQKGDLILVDDCDKKLFPEVYDTVSQFINDNPYTYLDSKHYKTHRISVLIKK